MKGAVDIIIHTLHVGQSLRVATLTINGKAPAREFLEKLRKDDSTKWRQLVARIGHVANNPDCRNQEIFKSLPNGIFEFKRHGIRLYAFFDTLSGIDQQLILCTNGGKKNTPRQQQRDIQKAQGIKQRYFAAKRDKTASFTLIDRP